MVARLQMPPRPSPSPRRHPLRPRAGSKRSGRLGSVSKCSIPFARLNAPVWLRPVSHVNFCACSNKKSVSATGRSWNSNGPRRRARPANWPPNTRSPCLSARWTFFTFPSPLKWPWTSSSPSTTSRMCWPKPQGWRSCAWADLPFRPPFHPLAF